jgi:hypothetical protein
MTVLITLTTAGSDTGPFDLYSDVDGFVVPFENNVPKASLLSGYTSSLVPNGTIVIRVKSDSICTNYIDLIVGGTTTTTTSTSSTTSTSTSTSTTTTTTTLPVEGTLYGLYGFADISGDACTQSGTYVSYGSPQLAVYAVSTTSLGVTQFFNDSSLLVPFDDTAAYNKYLSYSLGSNPTDLYTAYYSNTLVISGQTDCF